MKSRKRLPGWGLAHSSSLRSPSEPGPMMPAVSRREGAAAQLAQLVADGLTGCLIIVGVVGLAISRLGAFMIVIAIALLVMVGFAVLWITLFVRFRASFLKDAVTVPGGLLAANLPPVIEAPAGVIGGAPQVAVRM